MARQVQCGNELTICTVGALVNELLNALQASQDLVLDLSGVVRIDTAGLQLLAAVYHEAAVQGGTVRCVSCAVVREYAASAGMTHLVDQTG